MIGLVLGSSLAWWAGPAHAAALALYTTRSYYVENANTATWTEAGCAQAITDISFFATPGAVILDFGGQFGDRTETEDTEKTLRFNTAEIEKVTEAYVTGYAECVGEHIEDSEAVIIGTNTSKEAVSKAGGKAWAEVVKTVAAHVLESPLEADVISIWGGNDMEVEYSSGSAARAWAKGYSETTESPEVDYGSADGCSSTKHNNEKCLVENKEPGWSQKVEYELSWAIRGANPLPQIYFNTYASQAGAVNAEQWAQIDLWSKGKMRFLGPLDQKGFANSDEPIESWSQLSETLATAGLNNELHYSTEI